LENNFNYFCFVWKTIKFELSVFLKEDERKNADNMMNNLMEDKEFKDFMMKKVLEMGLVQT
jgi:hypothetical protein